jgi:hypothetical protein
MMPRKDTLRKYYPDSTLSDDELMRIAEWLRDYTGQTAVSPDNRILKALIAFKETF